MFCLIIFQGGGDITFKIQCTESLKIGITPDVVTKWLEPVCNYIYHISLIRQLKSQREIEIVGIKGIVMV